MPFRFAGLILFLLNLTTQASEGQFTVISDVQYCTGGGRPLLMDVFIPKHRNWTPTPAVLWIHGGGWQAGDKSDVYAKPQVFNGKGFVFVSHTGEVYPSGFLPLRAGNVRRQSLAEIYRTSPLFIALRDSKQLKGKCGICEYNQICGGSRARAYAVTGDAFAPDPCCVYQPRAAAAAAV